MSNPPYFTTGDALTGSFFWIAIRFPTSQNNWVFGQFLAAIDNLSSFDAWITGGETTTEEATTLFRNIFQSWIKDMPLSIGDIKFTGAPPDSGVWLLCDGSAVSQTTYANLYARIGTLFNTGGEPSGTFRVPDMRGRVPAMTNNSSGRLPSWADTPGGAGGEQTHQLVVSEMPSHFHTEEPHNHTLTPHEHTESAAIPTVINGGLEAPAPSATPAPSVTGFASDTIAPASATIDPTGGDGSHNNVQPTMALACYILADF